MEQLPKLAELRDAGVVTPEELEAKKAELLVRMYCPVPQLDRRPSPRQERLAACGLLRKEDGPSARRLTPCPGPLPIRESECLWVGEKDRVTEPVPAHLRPYLARSRQERDRPHARPERWKSVLGVA